MVHVGTDCVAQINGWVPAFLNAAALEEIWAIEILTREISVARPEPKRIWFYTNEEDSKTYLYLGKASMCDKSGRGGIQFDNGRHRTRWMLDQGITEIPVLLTNYSYFVAVTTGVLSRRAFIGDVIPGLQVITMK